MNPEAIGDVLSVAAAFDNRTVGIADSAAWFRVIGHLDQHEAEEAVIAHYGETNDRIMPRDVLARVSKLRALRIAHAGPESVPDADPDDVPAYQRALREGRFRVASGMSQHPVRRAIETAFDNGRHLRVESKWNRNAPITHRRVALPPASEPEPLVIDADYAAAEAVLAQLPDRGRWIIAARAELEAEGARITRAAEAIRAADLATRTEGA
jgi:hypothetical protein